MMNTLQLWWICRNLTSASLSLRGWRNKRERVPFHSTFRRLLVSRCGWYHQVIHKSVVEHCEVFEHLLQIYLQTQTFLWPLCVWWQEDARHCTGSWLVPSGPNNWWATKQIRYSVLLCHRLHCPEKVCLLIRQAFPCCSGRNTVNFEQVVHKCQRKINNIGTLSK